MTEQPEITVAQALDGGAQSIFCCIVSDKMPMRNVLKAHAYICRSDILRFEETNKVFNRLLECHLVSIDLDSYKVSMCPEIRTIYNEVQYESPNEYEFSDMFIDRLHDVPLKSLGSNPSRFELTYEQYIAMLNAGG